jgi:hypothetical protein
MSDTPAHDWLRPKLDHLLNEAAAHGIERSIAIAVLADLITGPDYDPGHLATDTDA